MSEAEIALQRIENILHSLYTSHTGKLPKAWKAELDTVREALRESR